MRKDFDFDFTKVILPCTRKFVQKKRDEKFKELRELIEIPGDEKRPITDHDSSSNGSHESNLKSIIARYDNLLMRKNFIPTGKETVQMGNGVLLNLSGKEKIFFMDNTAEGGKGKILSIFSPLGKEIMGKKVGFEGSFSCEAMTHSIKILRIFTYAEAKKILKNQLEF